MNAVQGNGGCCAGKRWMLCRETVDVVQGNGGCLWHSLCAKNAETLMLGIGVCLFTPNTRFQEIN